MRFRTAPVCLALLLLPLLSPAADPGANLQQALGSSDPLYRFPAASVVGAVRLCASRDSAHAPDYVVLVLGSGRNDADAIAPALVRAAILGLGTDPNSAVVSAIVYDAVHIAPTEVLDIVTAAVKASPRSVAPAIVTAAVRAVPDPEQTVTVNFQRRAERTAGTGKEFEDKQLPEAAEQKQLSLAEAIVQAALDADPGLSSDVLTAAVDSGLNPPPGTPPVPRGFPPPPPSLPLPPIASDPPVSP